MKKKSLFTKSISIMLKLLIVLGIIVLGFGSILLHLYNTEGKNKLQSIIEQKAGLNDTLFFLINRELMSIAIDDRSVQMLAALPESSVHEYSTMIKDVEYIQEIQKRLMNLANVYGNKYYFWIYEENTDSLVDFGSNDYKIRTEFRNRIKEKIRKGTLQLTQNNRWIIQDDMYIATSMKYESVYIGAWVSVSDYLLDLSKMKLSDSFRITLEDTQHQYVKSVDYSKAYGAILNNDSKLSSTGWGYNISVKPENLNAYMIFEIQWTLFENTVFAQTILVIFSLLLIIVIIGVSLYIYRKVLRPVMGFYNQIKNYSENFQYSVDESLVELDEAARMINRLYDEVHGLKEDNYIQRIKRQEAELSFVRLQIRPHFYINCLNVICSMAQLNKNEAIQDMCLNISDYMRLLFRKDTSLIQLSQELEMTDKYLRVIKNVYGQAFNYFLNVDCDSHAFLILPLLIQTFVENSIKYGGRDVEDVLEIWVNISLKENKENRMCIQIQDSGVGFGSDILGQLSQEHIESQDTTHQIGIMNIIQRLRLQYGNCYKIEFLNNEIGALVTIEFPVIIDGKSQEEKFQ